MEIFLIVLAVILAQAILGGTFYAGYRYGRRRPAAPQPLPDEEKQRIEQLNRAFKNVMSYDMSTAMRRSPNG